MDALGDEVLDVAYFCSSPSFGVFELLESTLPRPGRLTRIAALVVDGVRAWLAGYRYDVATPKKGGIAFFANTQNQLNALSPVAALLPDARVYGIFGFGQFAFPVWRAYWKALRWIGPVWRSSRSADPYVQESLHYFFDWFVLAHGYLELAQQWLEDLAPAALVVANDHSLPHRALVRAAQKCGIPTVYMQHAAVTHRFPPLFTDFALLDGEDALGKYDSIGESKTRAYLSGPARADRLIMQRDDRTGNAIGVCTNARDPLSRVRSICHGLREAFPDHEIILRPHPTDGRTAEWDRMAREARISLQSPRCPLEDYFEVVRVVVAGGSSVLMDAALAGVIPINYPFNADHADPYEFVANAAVPKAGDLDELVKLIESAYGGYTLNEEVLRRYCATIGTPAQGRSRELAAEIIARVANGTIERMSGWELIDDTRLKAFRPAASGHGEWGLSVASSVTCQ